MNTAQDRATRIAVFERFYQDDWKIAEIAHRYKLDKRVVELLIMGDKTEGRVRCPRCGAAAAMVVPSSRICMGCFVKDRIEEHRQKLRRQRQGERRNVQDAEATELAVA